MPRPPPQPLTDEQSALAAKHVKFARFLARKARGKHPRLGDEFESAALLGLVEAARIYDESRGLKFELFAQGRITGAMGDAWRKSRLKGFRRSEAAGDAPAMERIDGLPGRDGFDIEAEVVTSPEESDRDFERLIRPLPSLERTVIRMTFREDMTLQAVAAELGYTKQGIACVRERAMAILRHHVE